MQRFIYMQLFLASRANADGTDITNNLFSDLGPLLALFGESFAQQFLRESFTWLDHIIFAMAPLGIITAIIGAIRVGGPPKLKALIGRARENRASAELDFMSSTSHEVSELWNGEGLVRTMGKGKVKQIIFLEDFAETESLGLYTLPLAEGATLVKTKAYKGPLVEELNLLLERPLKLWKVLSKGDKPNNNHPKSHNLEEYHSKHDASNQAPNISLNIHPKQNIGELFIAAALGIILQLCVLVFSGFVAYSNRFGDMVGGSPSAYAFPTLASGTTVLVFGMGICALVIGNSTAEEVWERGINTRDTKEQVGINPRSISEGCPEDVEPGHVESSQKSQNQSLYGRILAAFLKRPIKEREIISEPLSEVRPSDRRKDCKKDRQSFLIFWLQKSFTVSDQFFDSYLLMAREEKEAILTSCRNNDHISGETPSESTSRAQSNRGLRSESIHDLPVEVISSPEQARSSRTPISQTQTSASVPRSIPTPSLNDLPAQKSSVWELNALCILGTSTGVIGFVLQFEGFRGISWACSIAQLVAIFIMTVVRAIIRRGMMHKPIAKEIQEGYEMDWLALRIGKIEKYLQNIRTSNDDPPKNSSCHVCGRFGTHTCNVLFWNICNEITPPVQAVGGWETTMHVSEAQKVVNIRRRLQELTGPGWSNLAVKTNAASVATAIERIMDLFKGWPNDKKSFNWSIDVQVEKGKGNATEKVSFQATRENKDSPWKVSAPNIESVISLCMYHLSDNHQKEGGTWDSNEKSFSNNNPPFKRVIGPSSTHLKRDLAWWAGVDISEALGEFDWENHEDGCLSLGFGREGFDRLNLNRDNNSQNLCYTMIAQLTQEKFLAQHIFSTFMWAIVDLLPISHKENEFTTAQVVLSSDDELRLYDKHPEWNSLRLTNKKIKKMTESIEISGLGSLEDAHLLVIPPLSCSHKLPNEDVVDMVRKKAQYKDLSSRERACNKYKKLLELCDDLPCNTKFVYKVVSTAVDFLVTVTSVSVDEGYMSNSHEPNIQESKHDLIKILRSKYPEFLLYLRQLYVGQDRLESFQDARILDDILDSSTLEEGTQLSIEAKIGPTPLQRSIMEIERAKNLVDQHGHRFKSRITRKFKRDKLLMDPLQLNQFCDVPDILGWTPLHYAVVHSPKKALELLKQNSYLANKFDVADRTPLHYAVMKGIKNYESEEIEMLRELSKATSEVSRGRDGFFPLHWAAKTGNIRATELLLERQQHQNTINNVDYWSMTPLHVAAQGGHLGIVNHLLKATPPEIDSHDRFGRTALHFAVLAISRNTSPNQDRMVEALIKKGAKVTKKGTDGKKALDLAADIEKSPNFKEIAAAEDIKGSKATNKEVTTVFPATREKTVKQTRKNVLESTIRLLLQREDLAADGGNLLLWAVKSKLMIPFDILIKSKRIAEGDKQLDSENGRSILHLAANDQCDKMVHGILERWKGRYLDSPNPCDIRDQSGATALILAASKGHASTVKILLDADVRKEIRDNIGRTALSWAAETGCLDVVKQLLYNKTNAEAADTKIANAKVVDLVDGDPEQSILARVAKQGNSEIAKLLMGHGATLELKGKEDEKTTFIAVENGRYDVVKLFLEKGADPNEINDQGYSILQMAICYGYKDIVNLLLEYKADVDKNGGLWEMPPLSIAAYRGNLEIMKVLLAKKPDIEAKDNTGGWVPLRWALHGPNPKVVQLLLEKGAGKNLDESQRKKQLNQVFSWACKKGDVDLVQLLLRWNTDVNARDPTSDSTPLIEASANGNLEVVELLVEKNALVDAKKQFNSTALLEAVNQGSQSIVKLLLKAKADVNLADDTGQTPLALAVLNEKKELVKLLLEANADVNLADDAGQTPLALAVLNKEKELVELLLEAGADTEEYPIYGITALEEAIKLQAEEIVDLLLSFGASTGVRDIQGRTAFYFAAKYGQVAILKKMIAKRLEKTSLLQPSSRDLQGRDVFHHAAAGHSVDMISYLLELYSDGSHRHRRDDDGWTPLHWAAQAGDLEVVQRLIIEDGADAKVQESIRGWTPRQIANYNSNGRIVDLLEAISISKEDLPSIGMVHWATCDGCHCIIYGIRYRCSVCKDFDFCEKCKHTSDKSHPGHKFEEIGPYHPREHRSRGS